MTILPPTAGATASKLVRCTARYGNFTQLVRMEDTPLILTKSGQSLSKA